MDPKPHRGRWQAQGADIVNPKGGHSVKWEEQLPPTKKAGYAKLAELAAKCEARQRALRESACVKARRHIERAPSGGYAGAGQSKPFYVDASNGKNKSARIDLEITAGSAFTS